MLGAMQHVKNPNITLDVYSSSQLYGSEFAAVEDHAFKHLYEQAEKLPNVNYIGYKPHEYILENLSSYDMFVYPSIFEETFCISALEALSAGLQCIVTNFGALYETCSEWPIYVNYTNDIHRLAKDFGAAITSASEYIYLDHVQQLLEEQQQFYKKFYSWEKKGWEWKNFLEGALNAKQIK